MSLTEIETSVKIDIHDLVRGMDRDQMKELITVMCEEEQDLGFEIELVELLVKNVKQEYTNSWDGSVDPEYKKFLKSLKKV